MNFEVVSLMGAALVGGLGATLLRRFWPVRGKRGLLKGDEPAPSRFSAIHTLLNSLEGVYSRGPDRDDIEDMFDPIEAVEERLWALDDFLFSLGFEDLRSCLADEVMKRGVNYCSMEYLRYFIVPEVRSRLHDLEIAKKQVHALFEVLHPSISSITRERYAAGNLADAVEAALKEVNTRVKVLVRERVGQELDGANLMRRAFSDKQPVIKLADLATLSGRSIQLGFMDIFAGAMTGIRNPKAHANLHIKETEAIYLLCLASLLMLKLDQEVKEVVEAAEPSAAADA